MKGVYTHAQDIAHALWDTVERHVQNVLLTSCHDTEISNPFMHRKSINVAIAKNNVTMVT